MPIQKLLAFTLSTSLFFSAGCESIKSGEGEYLGGLVKVTRKDGTPIQNEAELGYQAILQASGESVGNGRIDFDNFYFYYQKLSDEPLGIDALLIRLDETFRKSRNEFDRRSMLTDFTTRYENVLNSIEVEQPVTYIGETYLGEYDFQNQGFHLPRDRFYGKTARSFDRNVLVFDSSESPLFVRYSEADAKAFIRANPERKVLVRMVGPLVKAYTEKTQETLSPKYDSAYYYRIGGATGRFTNYTLVMKVKDFAIAFTQG